MGEPFRFGCTVSQFTCCIAGAAAAAVYIARLLFGYLKWKVQSILISPNIFVVQTIYRKLNISISIALGQREIDDDPITLRQDTQIRPRCLHLIWLNIFTLFFS